MNVTCVVCIPFFSVFKLDIKYVTFVVGEMWIFVSLQQQKMDFTEWFKDANDNQDQDDDDNVFISNIFFFHSFP